MYSFIFRILFFFCFFVNSIKVKNIDPVHTIPEKFEKLYFYGKAYRPH